MKRGRLQSRTGPAGPNRGRGRARVQQWQQRHPLKLLRASIVTPLERW